MQKIRKPIRMLFLGLLAICIVPALKVQADEPLVIVLDPGHGGENLGGEYDPYVEKDLTIIVARAMKEELEKYEGVEVYLTREKDEEMSLEDRALFAAQKQADFLFCLHFNMSVEHNLYGAEVWIPAAGEFYSKGYAFAEIEMQELTDLGLLSRGIKTRLNKKDENYYGILRHCTKEAVPSVLIEHCHLDNQNDQDFYQHGTAQLEEFGRLDARAVAKYFHLRSESLGVDYGNYPVSDVPAPSDPVRPDLTGPEICVANVTKIDEDTAEITVSMEAVDSNSYILYYSYSLDGGCSWSPLLAWPRPLRWDQSADEYSFTIQAPYDQALTLQVTAYNGFDAWAQSNPVFLEPIPDPERLRKEAEQEQKQEPGQRELPEGPERKDLQKVPEKAVEIRGVSQQEKATSYSLSNTVIFLLIVLIIICMGFVVFVLVRTVQIAANSKRR